MLCWHGSNSTKETSRRIYFPTTHSNDETCFSLAHLLMCYFQTVCNVITPLYATNRCTTPPPTTELLILTSLGYILPAASSVTTVTCTHTLTNTYASMHTINVQQFSSHQNMTAACKPALPLLHQLLHAPLVVRCMQHIVSAYQRPFLTYCRHVYKYF